MGTTSKQILGTPALNPQAEPELASSGEAVIAENVCERTGHDYTCSNHHFARDKHSTPFVGMGQDVAAKFQVWICRKCGGTVEVKILPKVERREAKLAPPVNK
jgi:rubrerythrin